MKIERIGQVMGCKPLQSLPKIIWEKAEESTEQEAVPMKRDIYITCIKRFFDFTLSLFALIILSPIFLTVAILVRIKLGSPIIYRQKRPGKDEKIFTIYKFKSMSDLRDEKGRLLPDSVRLTKFGKMLRASSLDELPELYNILKGDMSFVGPRPLAVIYLPYYNEKEKLRHTVMPGLTGLAQINGRNAISWEERFKYDVEYARKISFIEDLHIVMKTIKIVLSHKNIKQAEEKPLGFHIIRQREFGTDQNNGDEPSVFY